MYVVLHTLYQNDQCTLTKAILGNQQALRMELYTQIQLEQLSITGQLCLKLLKSQHPQRCVTHHNLVLIEDLTEKELYFNAELYIVKQFNSQQFSTDLRQLYQAYDSLQKVFDYLDMGLQNVFISNGILKVLDLGLLKIKINQSLGCRLALLLLKIHLPRWEYKPLKYMSSAQLVGYLNQLLSKLNVVGRDINIILQMVDQDKELSWDLLGDMLTSQRSLSNCRPSTSNSYAYAVLRVQSNLRSRSRKQVRSVYESQQNNQTVTLDTSITNQIHKQSLINNTILKVPVNNTNNSNNNNNNYAQPEIQRLIQKQRGSIRLQKCEDFTQDKQIRLSTQPDNLSVQSIQRISAQTIQPIESTPPQKKEIEYQLKRPNNHQSGRKYIPSFVFEQAEEIQTIFINEELNTQFESYNKKYKECYENINLIGKTIAKCIGIFDAYKNLWIMPLFIIFKRMYQLRLIVYNDLVNKKNQFKLDSWKEYLNNTLYRQLIEEIDAENSIVLKEVEQILQNCQQKVDKLDQSNRIKIEPLLNLDANSQLTEIAFVYLYSQIYQKVKELNIENMILKVQCSLIILETAPYKIEINYKEQINAKNQKQIEKNNSNLIDQLKQRIIQKGYTL